MSPFLRKVKTASGATAVQIVEKRGGISAGPPRRTYDIDRGEMEDPALGFGCQRSYDPRNLARELVEVMEAQLRAAAGRVVEP